MSEEAQFGMVMPFIVTSDHGGTYHGESFVVGYELGHLDAELAMCARMPQGIAAQPGSRYVHTGGVPQLDLIAMKHGYKTLTEEYAENPEWTWVDFERADDD